MDQSTGVVQRTIRASGRLMLLISALAFIVFVGLFLASTRLLINFVSGPRPISSQDLTAITDVGSVQHYWVNVTGDRIVDTGWQQVMQDTTLGIQTSQTVQDSYAVLVVGNRLLLVDLPGNVQADSTNAVTYTGALTSMSSDVIDHVVNDLRTNYPADANRLMPFVLDTHDFRSNNVIILIMIIVALLAALWFLYVGLMRLTEPQTHRIWKRLGREGDAALTAAAINEEFDRPHTTLGTAHITSHWLIDARPTTLKATRLEDVVWAYQKVTRRRVNGIPVGTTYEAYVWDRYNTITSFQSGQQTILNTLQLIHEAAPWAVMGYDQAKQTLWHKNRLTFIEAVRQRRETWAQQSTISRDRTF